MVEVESLRRSGGGYHEFLDVMVSKRRGNIILLSELERDAFKGITNHGSAASAHAAVRVPAPYAALLSQRRWRSIALPDLANALGGSVPMSIPWNILQEQAPTRTAMLWQGGPEGFGRDALEEIADALREGLPGLPAIGPVRERHER